MPTAKTPYVRTTFAALAWQFSLSRSATIIVLVGCRRDVRELLVHDLPGPRHVDRRRTAPAGLLARHLCAWHFWSANLRASSPRRRAVPASGSARTARFPLARGWSQRRRTAGRSLAFTPNGGWIMGGDARKLCAHRGIFPQRDVSVAANEAVDGRVDRAPPVSHSRPASCCAHRSDRRVNANLATARGRRVFPELANRFSIFAEASEAQGTILWIGGAEWRSPQTSWLSGSGGADARGRRLLHCLCSQRQQRDLAPCHGARCRYATRSVLFEFAAPEFSRRSALRLQNPRGLGVDDRLGWRAGTGGAARTNGHAPMARIPFGCGAPLAETGLVSEPAVFNFEMIAPPWWRTPPAMLGALARAGRRELWRSTGYAVRALRQHNAELEEKSPRAHGANSRRPSAAKTQFVANMSHDIRNSASTALSASALAPGKNSRLDDGQRDRESVATLREVHDLSFHRWSTTCSILPASRPAA